MLSFFRKFNSNDQRNYLANKNIILLFFNRIILILISFILVPITIDFVDKYEYGIWLTISSVSAWMLFFDFGLTHGFRNGFAEAIANGKNDLAKEYISTTYFILLCIFLVLTVLLLIVNNYINWANILKLSPKFDLTLNLLFNYLIIFTSLQMIANVFTSFLLAIQKPAFSALITTLSQSVSLACIYFISLFEEGNLLYLGLILFGVPSVIGILISVIFYLSKFKLYCPSFRNINLKLSNKIIGLGGKFFIIQLSMLLIFQASNFIIIRLLGSEIVSDYNISYKYYSMIIIFMSIVFTPYWSAFTEAHTKSEFDWMLKTYNRLSKFWFISIPLVIILFILNNFIYSIWLGSTFIVDYKLSILLGVYMLVQSRANLYMTCINGTGKIYLQFIIYSLFALITIPLMIYFVKVYSIYGLVFTLTLVYFTQGIFGHIQINKIINNKDKGIWKK